MPIPTIASQGAAAEGSGSTLAVDYPATVNDGDMLIFTCGQFSDQEPDVPTGFTQRAFINSVTACGVTVWTRIADGTETGSITITGLINARVKIGRMYRSNNADSIEAIGTTADSSKIILHADVSTSNPNRLVLCVSGVNDDETAASFDGETGGDLTLHTADTSAIGNDFALSLQTAGMASSGVISGGDWSYNGAGEDWATVSFAIFELADEPDPIDGSFSGLILAGSF